MSNTEFEGLKKDYVEQVEALNSFRVGDKVNLDGGHREYTIKALLRTDEVIIKHWPYLLQSEKIRVKASQINLAE